MNIYEQQADFDEERIKSKKLIKMIAIVLFILFLLSMCILFYISYLQNKQLKLYIDNTKISVTSNMVIITEDNNIYLSISDIAEKIGYTMNNGEYKKPYSEDNTKCYLENKYETVSYIQDETEIYKTIIPTSQDDDKDYEYYTIDQPVFMQDNKLYISIDGLALGCNLDCSYVPDNNTIKIYTLDYLTAFYSAQISGGTELVERDDLDTYKNKKAILYDMIVVKSEDGKYGVNSLNNTTIIGQKYKSITFIEVLQEFIVETSDGKFGIIDKEGKTKINPEYASIKQIEKDKGLYLVSQKTSTSSGKTQYGIINKNEKVIVYIEYDQIGIDKSNFISDEIDNQYILFGKCIPVKKSSKWGLLDLNGNTILSIEYDDLGCTANSSKNSQANNLLLIPEYEAVVVKQNSMYGLFNSSGKELIPALVTDMYSISSSGEKKYYLTYQGEVRDIIDYLQNTLGIEPVVSNDVSTTVEETNYNQEEPKNTEQQTTETNNTQGDTTEVNNTDEDMSEVNNTEEGTIGENANETTNNTDEYTTEADTTRTDVTEM